MHIVFFVWQDVQTDLHSLGNLGGDWQAFPLDDSLHIGHISTATPEVRKRLKTVHPNLTILPGPHGSLTADHVASLAKMHPGAKVGDKMEDVLGSVRTALTTAGFVHSLETFDASNY